MGKIEEKLLEEFKKSTKERREKLAKKFGFSCSEDYRAHLEGKEISQVEEVKMKPTIHNVVLLDATGSMSGGKYTNSCNGILTEQDWLHKQKDVNYTQTVWEFIQSKKRNKIATVRPINSDNQILYSFSDSIGGNTPLWLAVIEIVNEIDLQVGPTDKVLLKVYTDGCNNSYYEYLGECKQLIKEVQSKNWTVTFVGTKQDLRSIMHSLDLEESNCLAIDNTGEGFKEAFNRSLTATETYAKNVVAGKDVSKGFYKNIK